MSGVSQDPLSKFQLYPTIDGFASEPSQICHVYFSKIPQNGCSGINFFTQTLCLNQVYFCCPPIKDVLHTFKSLVAVSNISSILILPLWNSAHFWPFLHNIIRFRSQIVEHIVFCTEFLVFNKVDSVFSKRPIKS